MTQSSFQQLFAAPSPVEWGYFGGILLGIFLFIGSSEAVRLAFRWPPEFTRKLVHVSVAILIFFAPRLFVSALLPIVLAVLFTIFAMFAIRLRILKSLHAVARGAYGTVYYPLAFLILIVLFWNRHPEIVSLSMLALGLGDAAAAIVGESIRNPRVFRLTSDKKSVQGSVAMFLTTALGLLAGLVYFDGTKYSSESLAIAVLSAALISTGWEAISSRALDNLTIPISVAFVLSYVLLPSETGIAHQFALGTGLGLAVAIAAYFARFITASGAVAAFLLASLVFGVGGWQWTIPILVFFVLSSILSKLGKERKKDLDQVFEKSETRDHGQVAANGGIAGTIVLLHTIIPSPKLYLMYLGAVAAVTADTWGTEVGTYIKGRTYSVLSFEKVRPGTNGGISTAGFIGGLMGAAIVGLSSFQWISGWRMVLAVVVGGEIGSLIDSLLGATVQARYICSVCDKITERRHHCGEYTRLMGGSSWINNDAVNWACAFGGAAAMLVLI